MDEQDYDHSDDERLVRASLRAAYPATRSVFSQRRGEQIIRAAALEHRHNRPSAGGRVAASVAAGLTLLAGTAGAAGAALPGQPLYPLKRVVERAMIAATANDRDAAQLELRFAERRLAEASAVGTEEPEATSLAEKFQEHLTAAAALGAVRSPTMLRNCSDRKVPAGMTPRHTMRSAGSQRASVHPRRRRTRR